LARGEESFLGYLSPCIYHSLHICADCILHL
jgi:hypothetical protein